MEYVKGCGIRPIDKEFYKIAKEEYKPSGSERVDNYVLVYNSATVKAYLDQNEKNILLAIRGTADFKDVKADAQIAINRLKKSSRYKEDKEKIEKILNRYPPNEYDYFLTGHSLGGALINQLKRDFPFFKDAVEFNPAFQPYDLYSQQSNEIKRYYTSDDPLYNLGGRLFYNKVVVPTTEHTIRNIPHIGTKAYNAYQGHAINNFNSVLGNGQHKSNDIVMKKKDFIKEHKRLINLLDDVNDEKKDQLKELKKVLKQKK